MANTEISHVKQILGLQHGKEYTDVKSLRYGQLMIMTVKVENPMSISFLGKTCVVKSFPTALT